jgi:AAHS family 4-hydroxybenzoate transporter-like MFS transporter
MLLGSLACAASALALLLIPIRPHGHTALLFAGLAVNGLLANAVQTSLYALAAHVYPTGVRATGVAFAATLGRIGGLVSSLLGASVIGAGGGAYWYALAIAMVLAFAGLVWMPGHFAPAGARRV